jgi:hypothetical protein
MEEVKMKFFTVPAFTAACDQVDAADEVIIIIISADEVAQSFRRIGGKMKYIIEFILLE